ncbi:MAG: lipopolysaccharide transport periplasmic protein LptA [Pseudomonadales bacterium]|nr:lipopolysaccharide transport periplasmic protein LptA [Pseudomonadales bacterium]
MNAVKRLINLLTLVLLGCTSSHWAWAKSSDRDQPIQIRADAGMVNESTGVSIYTGNVTIDQGTMHIRADEVEVIMSDREVVQIIARATEPDSPLAHYEHVPDDATEPVTADAKRITYLVQEERLHLAGTARLKQVRDTFSGELLYYDVNKGIVDLKSDRKAGDRIKMTINPRNNP